MTVERALHRAAVVTALASAVELHGTRKLGRAAASVVARVELRAELEVEHRLLRSPVAWPGGCRADDELGFAGDGEAWAAYGSAMLEADRAARNAVVSHPHDRWRLGRNLGALAIWVLHARSLSVATQRTNDPSKGVCDASDASARRMARNARRTRRVLRHISSTSLTDLARNWMIAPGVTFAGSPGGRYEFV